MLMKRLILCKFVDECDHTTNVFTRMDLRYQGECQRYCSEIYADTEEQGRCLFYTYTRSSQECRIYMSRLTDELEDFSKVCKKIGGPKTPKFEDCLAKRMSDPCVVSVFTLFTLHV